VPGKYELELDCASGQRALVELCFWALGTYGGLGCRNRKGFGALRFPGLSGSNAMVEAGPHGWEAMAKLAQSLLPEVGVVVRYVEVNGPPAYEMFRDDVYVLDLGDGWRDWAAALKDMGESWRCLRATELHPRGGPQYRPFVETPEWKEVVVGEATGFELGMLGLPVGYKGKRTVVAVRNGDEQRLPSPIRFKPHPQENDWGVTVLAFFPGPPGSIVLKDGNGRLIKELTIDPGKADARIEATVDGLRRPAGWPLGAWPDDR
jgi:hypothetical protein